MTQKTNFLKIINFRPVLYSFLSVLFGILCTRGIFAGEPLYVSLVCIFFAVLTLLCLLYKKWVVVLVVILSFFVGIGGYFAGEAIFLGKSYEGRQEVVARVTDVISESDYYYNIVLDDCHVGGEKAKNITLSVKKDADLVIENGDILSFNAYVDHVHMFELEKFNSYYLRNRTAYKSSVNASEILMFSGKVKLDEKIRASLESVLFKNMSKDSASVAFAMLTGDKTNIDDEIKNDYAGAGIVHILTVSGLHITFLISLVSVILKKLKVNKYLNFVLIALFLIFYCYICGFTPSVLRASIMGLVLISASLFAREYDKFTALSIAGFILLFISPLYAFDVGFLMSFSCVGTIFLLEKPLERLLSKFLPNYFAKGLAVSISAEAGILPFLASFSQDFNLLSIFLNVFIIPVFEVVFILLFVSLLISFIPFMGSVLKLSDWLIFGINYVANFFASTKAKVSLKEFNILLIFLNLCVYFVLSGLFMAGKKIKALVVSILLCLISGFLLVDNLTPYSYKSSAYTLTSYSQQSVFLVSEEGEIAFVGSNISSIDERYLKLNKISKVDYFFAVDLRESELSNFVFDSRKFGAKNIISCEAKAGASEEVVAIKNEANFVGAFCYEYVYQDNTCLGLKIDFDNSSIFFASNSNLSYNTLSYMDKSLLSQNFDAVFLGKRYYSASLFENAKNVFALYDNSDVDYSYLSNGNLKVDLMKNTVRSLD